MRERSARSSASCASSTAASVEVRICLIFGRDRDSASCRIAACTRATGCPGLRKATWLRVVPHRRAEHTDRMRSPAHTSRRNEFLARRWQGCSGRWPRSMCLNPPSRARLRRHTASSGQNSGRLLAGRQVTLRLEPTLLHVIADGKLLRTLPVTLATARPGQARRRPASRGHPGAGGPARGPWLLCRW